MQSALTPEAKMYASQILRANFGPVVEKVGAGLLVRGASTLKELAQALQLTPTLLKNSLLVLIQQNIVQCEPRSAPNGGKSRGIQYEAIIDQILTRPWFARMLIHANPLFPETDGNAVLLLQVRTGKPRVSINCIDE